MTNKDHHLDIDNWMDWIGQGQTTAKRDREKEEILICECYCISLKEIKELRKLTGHDLKWDDLSEQFKIGLGCGTCGKNKEYWTEMINKGSIE